MKNLIVLPDNNYYLWQMLVQINNFKRVGCIRDTIYLIGKRTNMKSKILKKIMSANTGASFYVYNDTRTDFTYNPSLRLHLLQKLFKDNPSFIDETFFYLDPDVLFTKKMNFNGLLKNDTWYLSDTRSYIDSNYISSKGDGLLGEMCGVVDINKDLVIKNDKNAGGAQYLLKNVDHKFWEKVENDSIALYILMNKTVNQYSPKSPIQSWTADMWALLWNAWKFGHETKIIDRFNFSWATDSIDKWEKCNIYHNAGVVKGNGTHFSKVEHQKSPFNKEISCDENNCSYKYLEEIRDTEKNFNKFIF